MKVSTLLVTELSPQTATDCEQVSVETISQRIWARRGTCGKILTVDEVMILPIFGAEKQFSK